MHLQTLKLAVRDFDMLCYKFISLVELGLLFNGVIYHLLSAFI